MRSENLTVRRSFCTISRSHRCIDTRNSRARNLLLFSTTPDWTMQAGLELPYKGVRSPVLRTRICRAAQYGLVLKFLPPTALLMLGAGIRLLIDTASTLQLHRRKKGARLPSDDPKYESLCYETQGQSDSDVVRRLNNERQSRLFMV